MVKANVINERNQYGVSSTNTVCVPCAARGPMTSVLFLLATFFFFLPPSLFFLEQFLVFFHCKMFQAHLFIFFALAIKSTISPKSPGSFRWRTVSKSQDLGAQYIGVHPDILEHLPPPKKTGVCLLYCFVLSPVISLGAVPHHHLALSVKELTYSSNS